MSVRQLPNSRGEQDLMKRARRGDQAAFSALASHHAVRLYNMAYRMTGNHADATELTQQAFLRAYTRLADCPENASFESWVYQIACSLWQVEPSRPAAGHSGGAEGPETAVQRALASLDAASRFILLLKDAQQKSYGEIAKITGLPVETVQTRIHQARLQLRAATTRMDPIRVEMPLATASVLS